VLSVLAIRPGVTASEISEFVAMNKAIISKSVGVLTERRLILQVEDTGRSRQLFLTPEGVEMHDAMLPISLRGQEIILGDLTEDEVTQLNELLRRLVARAPGLLADDPLDEREVAEDTAHS
jgi:DNA-binding MarR family transcriptional regulator